MSILWRSWLTFSAVIFVVLLGFSVLGLLQHAALVSGLTRQRIAVVAESAGAAFRPIVDLGLPLSMMRNGNEVVARLRGTDPRITSIQVFNPSGVVVYTSDPARREPVDREVLNAQRLADGPAWSIETADSLAAGWTVRRKTGELVGGVLVTYPRDGVARAISDMNRRVSLLALALWAAGSLAALVLLRVLLNGPIQGVRRLAQFARGEVGPALPWPSIDTTATHPARGLLHGEIDGLAVRLSEASAAWCSTQAELAAIAPTHPEHDPPAATQSGTRVTVLQSPQTSVARELARRLLPWAAFLTIVPALVLGGLTMRAVNRSIEPEITSRMGLIATLVGGNVQRAVSAGVPIEELGGAAGSYADNLLKRFPEIAYVAVASGRIVLATGTAPGVRLDPPGGPTDGKDKGSGYPIRLDGKEVGYVLVDMKPAFVARRFLDVFLDLAVVVLVAILLAFEILVLMLSRTLTGPLDRLHHLLAFQSVGDFSRRVASRAHTMIDAITVDLSDRAVRLNATYARLACVLTGTSAAALAVIGTRRGLSTGGPDRLIFPYFTDIRLALFLFAAAEELPLSFMPLYTRAAGNPWPWVDSNVLISLPLAGYLFAIVLVSPFARELARRYGYRRVLVAAVLPNLIGQLGLAFAGSAAEIIALRTLTGVGYAIVTLACQDYVLDATSSGERSRSLALFTLVLFGGIFSGTALGGVLADRLGFAPVFLISAGLIASSAALFWRLLPARDQAAAIESGAHFVPPLLAPMSNPRFVGLVLGIAIPANVLIQVFLCYLVALVLDSLGASPGDIGRTLMTYFLVVALFSPVAARIAEGRVPPSLLALSGAILSGGALLPVALYPGQWTMLFAVLLVGLGHAVVRGPQVSVAMAIAETDLSSLGPNSVLAALRTLERAGSIVGLIGVAAVAGMLGYRRAILVVALWVLGGALLFLTTEFAHVLRLARAPNDTRSTQ